MSRNDHALPSKLAVYRSHTPILATSLATLRRHRLDINKVAIPKSLASVAVASMSSVTVPLAAFKTGPRSIYSTVTIENNTDGSKVRMSYSQSRRALNLGIAIVTWTPGR